MKEFEKIIVDISTVEAKKEAINVLQLFNCRINDIDNNDNCIAYLGGFYSLNIPKHIQKLYPENVIISPEELKQRLAKKFIDSGYFGVFENEKGVEFIGLVDKVFVNGNCLTINFKYAKFVSSLIIDSVISAVKFVRFPSKSEIDTFNNIVKSATGPFYIINNKRTDPVIGSVCKFWDEDKSDFVIGKLVAIDRRGVYRFETSIGCYENATTVSKSEVIELLFGKEK